MIADGDECSMIAVTHSFFQCGFILICNECGCQTNPLSPVGRGGNDLVITPTLILPHQGEESFLENEIPRSSAAGYLILFVLLFLLFHPLFELFLKPFYFFLELFSDCFRLNFVRDDMGGQKKDQLSPVILARILSEEKPEQGDLA